jgi:N-acetylmuramic acid 6-phosphate etherase
MAAIAALQSQTAAIAAAAEQAAQRLDTDGGWSCGRGHLGAPRRAGRHRALPTFGWTMERMVFLMAGGSERSHRPGRRRGRCEAARAEAAAAIGRMMW